MNRKSTSVWTLSSVVTILCLMAGCLHGVGFTWTGVIVMTPESGLVACGNDLGARVVDAFDVARPLPDNEYVVDEGNPTYSWYLNDSEIPCKWGRSVVFSMGDWDECGEYDDRPDIDAGDFTLSVKGSRTYVVGWDDGNGCSCGCGMDDCECGGNGFRGCGGCGGKETKRGSSRQDAPTRGRHEEAYPINNYLLAYANGTAVKIIIEYNGEDVTSKTQTIIVGQKANLSVKIKNSILFPSRYLWSIPGVIFKNFDGTKQSNPYSHITLFDLGNENIAFYWTDGEHLNNSNINNSCVRCIVFIGAQSFTGQTTFNIQRPYVTVYCNLYLSYTIATFNNGDKGLYFGNNDINVPGINLSGAYLGAINGSFCWVQVLNKSYSMINKGTNGIKYEDIDDARDGEFPYKSGLNMNDSPHILLLSGTLSAFQSLNASAFLMFMPRGNDAAWVPLAKVDWSCEGFARNINGTWTADTITSPQYTIINNETTHPIWKCVAEEVNHVSHN